MNHFPLVLVALIASSCSAPLVQAQPNAPEKSQRPLAKLSVVIDAGHGGADAGDGEEKDLNLSLALQLRAELEKQGMQVVMTRANDKFVTLADRVGVANKINPACFVSIHSVTNYKSPRYFSVDYYQPQSRLLAQLVNESLGQPIGRQAPQDATIQRFYVVRNVTAPSVLVTANTHFYATPQLQKGYVDALVRGINSYVRHEIVASALESLEQNSVIRVTPPRAPSAPTSPLLHRPQGTFNFLSGKAYR